MSSKYGEIGSEFWIETVPDMVLTERDGDYAISGRTAIDLILQEILRKRHVKNVAMPAWCCDSMLAPFLAHGIKVNFYDLSIDEGRGIEYHINITESTDILYVTNYFGYDNTLPVEAVKWYKEQGAIILYDRTHSFLMEDVEYQELADFHFASIRKWMGIVGGAVVNQLTEKPMFKECPYASIKEKAMREKFQYLQGDTNIVKENFLKAFGEFGHHLVADYCNYAMDNLSYSLYKQEDLQLMAKKRRENASYLHDNIKGVKFIGRMTDRAIPLFVPIFFERKEKRDAVRKSLIENQIFCPVHWPKPQQLPMVYAAHQIVDTELSVICDQRYGLEEMIEITNIINTEI